MLDDFKEESIVNKVGGRFKLSSLIQKRLVALNRGARPLVELNTKNMMEVVVAEIMQDKIFLDASGALVTAEEAAEAGRITAGGPTLDDL
ncbi:MAG: DNA-directed RNA polymerase subunit omega [Planctomycetaceae bacterium]